MSEAVPSDTAVADGAATGERRFDTSDRRLQRWGCSVRHQPGEGWIVTIPQPDKRDPTGRDDVAIAGRATKRPPAVALRLVEPLTLGAPVTDVADLPPADLPPSGWATADRGTSARAVVRRAIESSVHHLLAHLPAARIGVDPEGVHQARVATRRLRSDLRTFGPLLDHDWTDELRSELKWLADALGEVRDADVLLMRLRATIEAADDVDRDAGAAIVELLQNQRDERHAAFVAVLDDRRARTLYRHLVAAADDPPTVGKALGRADKLLAPLVRKPWRKLSRAVEALGEEPEIAELHRIRLLAKRVRYAAEAVAPAFGRPAQKFASDVADLQDVLGELNDAEVTAGWLADNAGQLDGRAGFAAGRLAERVLAESVPHRHDWERHYRRAARPKRHAWFAAP